MDIIRQLAFGVRYEGLVETGCGFVADESGSEQSLVVYTSFNLSQYSEDI